MTDTTYTVAGIALVTLFLLSGLWALWGRR